MSFKNFSLSQAAPTNDKPEDKTKATPAVNQPAAQPDKQPGKKQNEVAPAQKS